MMIFDTSFQESVVLVGFPIALVVGSVVGVMLGRLWFPRQEGNSGFNLKFILVAIMTVIAGMGLYIMGGLFYLNSG